MTDRYTYLTVALDREIRDDDAQPLIDAIKMLKGVMAVEPHIADINMWVAEERARQHLREQLLAILYPKAVRPE
jgi:hypothetical protein